MANGRAAKHAAAGIGTAGSACQWLLNHWLCGRGLDDPCDDSADIISPKVGFIERNLQVARYRRFTRRVTQPATTPPARMPSTVMSRMFGVFVLIVVTLRIGAPLAGSSRVWKKIV